MTKCLMVVPWGISRPQFPGVDESLINGWTCGSYVPPPEGNHVLVWLNADQSVIDTLSSRNDCLYICLISDDGIIETTAIGANERNAVATKVRNMGLPGLVNAAIQSSQNRSQLAFALATKGFYRNKTKDPMTELDVRGTAIG